jgi:hypothetical protein
MKFYDLMRRRAPQYFYAFDLLWKDGQDLRGLPLVKRKRLLKKDREVPSAVCRSLGGPWGRSVSRRMPEGPGGNCRQGGAGAVSAREDNLDEDQESKLSLPKHVNKTR